MKERRKKADLEGSAEDAEFNKGHMVVQRRGIGGWQLRDRALLLCPLHSSQTSSRWLHQILPSHPPSSPLLSFLSILKLEILRRKLLTLQNTSDSQPTLQHPLNDKRISHCGAYVVTGDHDFAALQNIVDLIRSTLILKWLSLDRHKQTLRI
jgi:hypothetical protein